MNATRPEPTLQPQPTDADFAVQLARKRHDPILEELWAVKAQINAEAGYDVNRIAEMARKAAAPYIDANGRVCVPPQVHATPTAQAS